jgi:hypothetical protein
VVSVNVSKGRIKDVFVVTNPEKLARLPDMPNEKRNHEK